MGRNVSRYEAVYRIIQAVTRSGIKAGADSSLAMAELSKSRITYNQTEGQIRQLQQQLSYLTGMAAGDFLIDTAQTKRYLSGLNTQILKTLNLLPTVGLGVFIRLFGKMVQLTHGIII